MNGWAGFWIFMLGYLVIDTWLFLKGFDTFFWEYKTPEEKELQRIKIENERKKGAQWIIKIK